LCGAIISKDMAEKQISGIKLYPFCVTISGKVKLLFATSDLERNEWMHKMMEAIGYLNFLNFYEVDSLLGKGGFGEVRNGVHKQTKKQVAVKIIDKASMTNMQIDHVRYEIETLKICQHPNIMGLYETFENQDNFFLVLEYLGGVNLYEYLKDRNYSLPEADAKRLIYQITCALQYLHNHGIIHRDIKLENFVFANQKADSDLKLVDFGLSKIMGTEEFTSECVGTLCYAAPELLMGLHYNKLVDMWSLGILTYGLLVGRLPYSETLPGNMIAKLDILIKIPIEKLLTRT
jgi:calcium-dependent protein kinase